MEALQSSRSSSKWKRKPTNSHNFRIPIFTFLFLLLFFLFFFVSYKNLAPISILPISRNSHQFLRPKCSFSGGEKFMWYAPHSGFSNQLSEFKNAIVIAAILNRTLVVPPILDHHAVALGSCPKFRVLDPSDLRFRVWNHSVELIREGRYVSMADIIDLSALTSISAVRFMDFREFASLSCGVNVNYCSDDLDIRSSMYESLMECGLLLSGYKGNIRNCFYAVNEDCRTTVWTFQKDGENGVLDLFQPDDELKKKKKISYVRKRRDVYKVLGSRSEAETAAILAFGSLFTTPYKGSESHIDIHEAPKDQRLQSLIQKIEFLPSVPEIINAGKKYALGTIKAPFLCAQLRLLDGQFKNHWKSTFQRLEQKLESLKQNGSLPIHVFVMTDLPTVDWRKSFLGDLAKKTDTFKLYVLSDKDELVVETAKKIVKAGYSLKFGSLNKNFDKSQKHCYPQQLPDILLHIEESVCSCATLGFIGTTGSTIAENIEIMRKYSVCSG